MDIPNLNNLIVVLECERRRKIMDIPNLNNLIAALECENWSSYVCKSCPYGYQHWDDSGDNGFWWCDENKKLEDALFYLKLYQCLIETEDNKE